MTPTYIDDPGDERLADYLELRDPAARRRRERDEFFIAEGLVAISRLIASPHRVRSLLLSEKKSTRLDELGAIPDVPVYVASRQVIESVAGFDLHRGAVAAADRRPPARLDEVLVITRRLAVLEGLNDAENLGAIARSARALGVDALVLDPRCADPYYRRVVRVSMGEILQLPVCRADDWPADLTRISSAGFETWAMTPAPTADSLWECAPPERAAVVLGAEGPGLSPGALAACDRAVRVPMEHGNDSLNVGHAAAVVFAALARAL